MTIQLLHGNCLDQLKTLPDNSVDSVVTDPPYGLSQHTQQQVLDCLTAWIAGEEYKPKGKGFMGKEWDVWVPGPEVWKECLRVLKPGGHILAFAGTRSMDLMSMAIRLAGFELRDAIGHVHDNGGAPLAAWAYGSGFPKSLDVSKAIDKAAGAERKVVGMARGKGSAGITGGASVGGVKGGYNYSLDDFQITAPATEAARQWQGWGTALKPAWEPIILARKPLEGTVADNVMQYGTGGLNIDGCRVGETGARNNGNSNGTVGSNSIGVFGKAEKMDYGKGRFPANLIHDGSDEVMAAFPDTGSKSKTNPNFDQTYSPNKKNKIFGGGMGGGSHPGFEDTSSSSSRFFYCAKASAKDRDEGLGSLAATTVEQRTGRKEGSAGALNPRAGAESLPAPGIGAKGNGLGRVCETCGTPQLKADQCQCETKSWVNPPRKNFHPTVKPTELMRYLCKLVTPPGGTVLDPFMGSGSTGKAAVLEGFDFIGCEMSQEYMNIAQARIQFAVDKVEKEEKEKNNDKPTLF